MDGGDNKSHLDGAYIRVLMLASIVETAIRELLDPDPDDAEHRRCNSCNKSLKNLAAMINHLTSAPCNIFEKYFPETSIINKNPLNGMLHAIRLSRNSLVHRLEVTTNDLNRIESEYQKFRPPPYTENRWEKLGEMTAHIYCYLSNGLIQAALRKRGARLSDMTFRKYVNDYLDNTPEFLNIQITWE